MLPDADLMMISVKFNQAARYTSLAMGFTKFINLMVQDLGTQCLS
jgi:hypothetical protein